MAEHHLSAALLSDIEERLAGWSAAAPSLSLAVFDRGGLIATHGVGEFRGDGRVPGPDTVYRIASMTKSFCAATVLALVERGRLALDAPVTELVPEFPASTPPVTVRMLLANSSGLPEDNAWADHHLDLGDEAFRALLARGLSFSEPPGEVYQYSNLGWAVLGLVLEAVTGMPAAEAIEATVIRPLGLRSTRFGVPAATDAHGTEEHGTETPDAGVARGSESFDGGASWFERPMLAGGAFDAAAALFSTAADVASWSAWLSAGFEGTASESTGPKEADAVLSRAGRRLMQRIHTPIPPVQERMAVPEYDNVGYGMGLVVEQHPRFGVIAQHSGGLPGFSTNMRWHTTSGLGVVILGNTNGLASAVWARELLGLILDEQQPAAREVALWPETLAAARAIDAAVLAGHVAEAEQLFSPNVLHNVPSEVRDARLGELFQQVGGSAPEATITRIEQRMRWSVSAAQLCWTVPGRRGELECRIELTPLRPPTVQRIDIVKAGSDAPLAAHWYRPLPPERASNP